MKLCKILLDGQGWLMVEPVGITGVSHVGQPSVGVDPVVVKGLVSGVQNPRAVVSVGPSGVRFTFLPAGNFFKSGSEFGLSGGHLRSVLDRFGSNT